ncbi:hypothetical protein EYZ11_006293 [Aspergillus tanneri]|uniref:DUF1772 domain-containing protein n=1 Tax=Aspergillus tanneri TaxID=1220188 RepID=A0A4S3JG72_9EURO|nr:uncharacterized protein ATNIH1004_008016 [Aspergillus tanneri]KAA8646583.1 hypothetical protein ATNIH1004_008016 [Aspergillus tanneri]THC94242.1 hypothetical protein EYZ11_006293 [Aspergillus tanneri]
MAQNTGQIGIQATAVISGSFLSGAMTSLSLITIPVILDTGTQSKQLLDQFVALYNYGHRIMPALSVTTCALYGFVANSKRAAGDPWSIYGVAAATTIAMVPFTWIFMVPINNTLFALHAAASDAALEEVRGLSVQWQWLHVARSLFPLAGAIIGWKALRAALR